uniref:NADH-ubiquinone oxidoreductase chain 4L n=1 Tax=Petropedetes sp. MVZ 234827 TaxID=1338816 RepID=S4V0P4_9NEOB|nr:NADH dehydrogenase subunit 4L [Petropedetes sp. MVZ 234827]
MLPLLMMMFLITLMGLSFHRMHLLSALLCIEGMMLTIFIGLSLWLNYFQLHSLSIPLIVLTLSACEAGLGLSLMIATARSHGSDNLNLLNLLQC